MSVRNRQQAVPLFKKLNKNTSRPSYRVENQWAEIDFQGRGWVAEPYIQVSENHVDMKKDTAGATARVTATGLNVRNEASLSEQGHRFGEQG